jgi:hypothetical protein
LLLVACESTSVELPGKSFEQTGMFEKVGGWRYQSRNHTMKGAVVAEFALTFLGEVIN